jgi:hypothetical protein
VLLELAGFCAAVRAGVEADEDLHEQLQSVQAQVVSLCHRKVTVECIQIKTPAGRFLFSPSSDAYLTPGTWSRVVEGDRQEPEGIRFSPPPVYTFEQNAGCRVDSFIEQVTAKHALPVEQIDPLRHVLSASVMWFGQRRTVRRKRSGAPRAFLALTLTYAAEVLSFPALTATEMRAVALVSRFDPRPRGEDPAPSHLSTWSHALRTVEKLRAEHAKEVEEFAKARRRRRAAQGNARR